MSHQPITSYIAPLSELIDIVGKKLKLAADEANIVNLIIDQGLTNVPISDDDRRLLRQLAIYTDICYTTFLDQFGKYGIFDIPITIKSGAKNDNNGQILGATVKIGSYKCPTYPGDVGFYFICKRDGSLHIEDLMFNREKTIIEEGVLMTYLEKYKGTHGYLIIVTSNGLGGFSDKIAEYMEKVYGLNKFANSNGCDAYYAIVTHDNSVAPIEVESPTAVEYEGEIRV